MINEFIRSRLAAIFDLPAELVPRLTLEVTGVNDESLPVDPNGSGSGGGGSGNILYGSDDFVFDPDSGELVQYGEILNESYARVIEQLRERENMPEELRASIYKYFEILFGAIKETEE